MIPYENHAGISPKTCTAWVVHCPNGDKYLMLYAPELSPIEALAIAERCHPGCSVVNLDVGEVKVESVKMTYSTNGTHLQMVDGKPHAGLPSIEGN